MKHKNKICAMLAAACFLLTAFLPVFIMTKGQEHVIGRLPLWVIYPGLIEFIRIHDLRYIPIVLLWIGMHLFLSIAPAWLVIRIWNRRKQSK